MELGEFMEENPELAKELMAGRPVVTTLLYAYRLSQGKKLRIIERIWIKEYEAGGKSAFHIARERHNPMDPFQKKLCNCSAKQLSGEENDR